MNSSAFSVLMMLFTLISGGGSNGTNRDLLDMMNTDTYWRVKSVQVTVDQLETDAKGGNPAADLDKLVKGLSSNDFQERDTAKTRLKAAGVAALDVLKVAAKSKDAEVAATADELIDQISTHLKELKIRQLMAIRTLGEHKEKGALDTLKPLLDSKEPFVATYTRRAIAAINGETLGGEDHRADMVKDLALLPAECGIVGQTTGLGTPKITIDWAVEKVLAGAKPGDVPQFRPNQKQVVPDIKKTSEELTRQLLIIAEQIGDVRADGVTVGVSKDLGERGGWGVFSLRGQYDAAATVDMLKRLFKNDDQHEFMPFTLYKIGTINAIQIEDYVTILMPSDQQMIVIAADGRMSPMASVVVPVALGLIDGKAGLEEGSKLAGLVKDVDKSGPLWGAGVINDSLKQAIPPIAPVDSAVVTAKPGKGGYDLTLTAKTSVSADENTGLAGTVNIGMIAVLTAAQGEVEHSPEMAVVVDFLKTVKAVASPTGGTITATLPSNIGEAMIMSMRWEVIYMMTRDDGPNGAAGGVEIMNNPPNLP